MDINSDTVEAYRSDGVTVLRQVFSSAWIERLREGLEENIREPGPYWRDYGKNGSKTLFSATIATGSGLMAIGISY